MSEHDEFVPASRLTVCIDFKSPQGWLAVAPTRALEAELGIEGDWLPVSTRVSTPPRTATTADDRGVRHRHMRAQYYENDLQRYAALRGIALGSASRSDESTLAGIGLLFVKRSGTRAAQRYIDAVYSRYFTAATPISLASPAAIAEAVAAADCNPIAFAAFAADEGARAFAALQSTLTSAGLANSPAYFVEGDVFNGRAHLPMLRWLLTGRVGRPPI